jgi:hypothetical protein
VNGGSHLQTTGKSWKPSAGKFMAREFWESEDVLFIDFLTEQRPINADYYLKLLKDQGKANSPFKTTRTISQKRLSPP